jgi:hypothetical protein
MKSVGVLVLLALASGCALVHERAGTTEPEDVGVPVDAASPPIDVGTVTSCFAFWEALPACPASPGIAIGRPCTTEGATCGVHCCEPGPPIACAGGVWTALDHMDDCAGVRCRGPHPCGAMGACAADRVCVVPAGELGGPGPELCVMPPAPIATCGEAPPGSIGDDPGACTACECRPSPSGDVVVTLDCRCC